MIFLYDCQTVQWGTWSYYFLWSSYVVSYFENIIYKQQFYICVCSAYSKRFAAVDSWWYPAKCDITFCRHKGTARQTCILLPATSCSSLIVSFNVKRGIKNEVFDTKNLRIKPRRVYTQWKIGKETMTPFIELQFIPQNLFKTNRRWITKYIWHQYICHRNELVCTLWSKPFYIIPNKINYKKYLWAMWITIKSIFFLLNCVHLLYTEVIF